MKRILTQIEPFEYISFDVFDTLIFRTVPRPYDQLHLVPLLIKEKYGWDMNDFYQLRVNAENMLRKQCNGAEITLNMIYDQLPYSKKQKHTIMQMECEVEVDNCVPNVAMIEVLRECRRQGKLIVIITDMYLPRIVFDRIFTKIDVQYDFLFISSEEGETKNTGKLYPIVLKKLNITHDRIVHIGDDKISDIQRAEENGIHGIERIYDQCGNAEVNYYTFNKTNFINNHFLQIINSCGVSYNNDSVEFKLGYNLLGPFLFNFCKWIHQKKNELGLERLWFVAREGFLIKKCYDLIYPEDNQLTQYIRLNKNLLRIPSLNADNSTISFAKSLPPSSTFTWTEIIEYLGFEDREKALRQLLSFSPNLKIPGAISDNQILHGSYAKELDYLINFKQQDISNQTKLLVEYLSDNGIINRKIGLVNNSANGSGQSMLIELLKLKDIKSDIVGLQFIKSVICKKRLSNRCFAWFDDYDISGFNKNIFWRESLIFEHMNFEPSGTAIRFFKSGDKVEVECEQPRREQDDFESISNLQNATIRFVSDYICHCPVRFDKIAILSFIHFLQMPNLEDAVYCSNLWDDDVDGDKQINDKRVRQTIMNAWSTTRPNGIKWPEASYIINNQNILLKIYRIRLFILYIIQNIKSRIKNLLPN